MIDKKNWSKIFNFSLISDWRGVRTEREVQGKGKARARWEENHAGEG